MFLRFRTVWASTGPTVMKKASAQSANCRQIDRVILDLMTWPPHPRIICNCLTEYNRQSRPLRRQNRRSAESASRDGGPNSPYPSPKRGCDAIFRTNRFAESERVVDPARQQSGTPVPASGGIAARARANAAAPYLNGLNPEQREAVETLDGPVLVLAGAGTGKTRVLTTRIAHILSLGKARPSEILSVTFTNKAAREMKLRVGAMVGQIVEGMPWLGTFHSIGVKILRRHAELVGLKPDFTILDVDDQIRLLKQLLEAGNIDEKRWPARVLASIIDGWKNRGLTPDKVPPGESASFANGRGLELYKAYQARLKTLNAADFGDLLIETLRLFREHPEVLRQYHERFRYVLVDEYQDTNVAQYLWLRLIGQGSKNICCVGDDDQSIYGWRGAEVDNILRFEKDFPGAKVIRLERNYRSTGHILASASHLIAHNEGRLGKTLRTEDEPGEKVAVTGAWDSEEEARAIGEEIEELQRAGHSLEEMAILVRASFQMREFEDRFVTLGLPYRVIGGPRFYERAEIRDALAYLRLVNQPADDLAFERIINTPRRGLGDATLQALQHHARRQNVPLLQAARLLSETEELKAKPRGAIRDLVEAFDRWRAQKDTLPHTELAEIVLDESGYTEMWQKDRSADAAGRLENLKELVRSMEEFENLAGFLEHISLVMDTDKGEGVESVSIMTLALRQGARIRHRVPARLGGRPAAASALARRSGPRRASKRSAASPMWASRARGAARKSISRRTAASMARGRRASRRAFSTSCPRRMCR